MEPTTTVEATEPVALDWDEHLTDRDGCYDDGGADW